MKPKDPEQGVNLPVQNGSIFLTTAILENHSGDWE
jgi:hypothetical protein